MKVGLLTTFYNLKPEYSLTSVVIQQLKSLVKYGYEAVLFVLDNFEDSWLDAVPQGVELRKVIPQLILEPYSKGDLSNLDKDVAKARAAMEEHMQDIDVCLTHDIIFINSYLPYNIALKQAIDSKLGHIGWLHWIHSAPSFRPNMDGSPWDNLYTLPKNSKIAYMNYTDTIRAAEMYGVWPKDVRTIFNPMDIRELYNFHPLTKQICDMYDVMSADIIDVYPVSTTRMGPAGKQLNKVIPVMGYLKKLGMSVRLIIPNAHANAKEEKEAINGMLQYAYNCGLAPNEIIFTSLIDAPKWEDGAPHDVVRDLFLLSNVFIFPSVSENCPLILLEAMAAKNILILNGSFPAMKDFAQENAMYFLFGSLVDEPRHVSEEKYYEDVAKLIISELNTNKSLKAATRLRRDFNLDAVFRKQLEPAIMEIYRGKQEQGSGSILAG
jgi:hypothetical protein